MEGGAGYLVNFQKKKKWRASAEHRTPTFIARGRGRGEEVAARPRAAEESERSGRVKPGGTIRRRAACSSRARRAGSGDWSPSGHWHRVWVPEPEQRWDASVNRGAPKSACRQQEQGPASAQQGSRGSGEGAQATVSRRGAPSPTSISDGGN